MKLLFVFLLLTVATVYADHFHWERFARDDVYARHTTNDRSGSRSGSVKKSNTATTLNIELSEDVLSG